MNFEAIMDYDISLPVLEDLEGYKELIYVLPSSDESQKEALERMAGYFKKEFRYDHLQYCKENHSENCIGILFAERAMDIVKDEYHYPNRVVGGACFGKKESGEFFLDWVWLHPFSRNHKKLSSNWPKFQKKFGQFTVTAPLSAHMASFLKKYEQQAQLSVPHVLQSNNTSYSQP
jgi:hypothetical protein